MENVDFNDDNDLVSAVIYILWMCTKDMCMYIKDVKGIFQIAIQS